MRAVYVGNDIVDLERPRTEGRSRDERFLARVFDVDERATIAAAGDADLEVWAHWAAKEAGFKVISKLIGSPPAFVHRTFKVTWTGSWHGELGAHGGDILRAGRVTHEGHEAEVAVARYPGCVHSVAFGGSRSLERVRLRPCVAPLDAPDARWSEPFERLRTHFSDEELDAVYSRRSAAVRLGARADLARAMLVDEHRLQIVCDPGATSQRPPRVRLDGRPTAADVSLSHDGAWLAWVLWTPTEPERS